MALALFDLDNTLLNGDSDHSWGVYLGDIGVLDRQQQQQQQDYFYQQYQNGTLDIDQFLNYQLQVLGQHSGEQLRQWRQRFIDEVITPMLAHDKLSLLEQHRANGDTLVIITATNDFVTAPIAELIGVEHLIATTAETDGDNYTGRYSGTPCFQHGKVTRLEAWMQQQQQTLDGAYFYSDSYNDLPLLERVQTPVAVTPDNKLRQHALDNHWMIID